MKENNKASHKNHISQITCLFVRHNNIAKTSYDNKRESHTVHHMKNILITLKRKNNHGTVFFVPGSHGSSYKKWTKNDKITNDERRNRRINTKSPVDKKITC